MLDVLVDNRNSLCTHARTPSCLSWVLSATDVILELTNETPLFSHCLHYRSVRFGAIAPFRRRCRATISLTNQSLRCQLTWENFSYYVWVVVVFHDDRLTVCVRANSEYSLLYFDPVIILIYVYIKIGSLSIESERGAVSSLLSLMMFAIQNWNGISISTLDI